MTRVRRRRTERAQAAVELALTLPVLIIAVLVVLQILLVARDAAALTAATRSAARALIVDDDPLQAALHERRLIGGRLSITQSGGADSGDFVTVVATYRSPTEVPLVGRFVGDITLEERFVVRRE